MRCWFGSVHSHRFVGVVVFFLGGWWGRGRNPCFLFVGFILGLLECYFTKKIACIKLVGNFVATNGSVVTYPLGGEISNGYHRDLFHF